jgi:hypothetical protein
MLLVKSCDLSRGPHVTDPEQSFSAIMMLGDANKAVIKGFSLRV